MAQLVTLELFKCQYAEILQEILRELELFSLPVEVSQWIEQASRGNEPCQAIHLSYFFLFSYALSHSLFCT